MPSSFEPATTKQALLSSYETYLVCELKLSTDASKLRCHLLAVLVVACRVLAVLRALSECFGLGEAAEERRELSGPER